MKSLKTGLLATAVAGIMGSGTAFANQQTVDQISQLKFNYTVVDNHAALHGVDCASQARTGHPVTRPPSG